MTPERQRIAIAEVRGWTDFREVDDELQPSIKRLEGQNYTYFTCLGFYEVPDYPSDLNAMHEAVHSRVTSPELQQEYFYQLNDVLGLVDCSSPAWIKEFAVFAHSQATASQRAEAFLRTLNLWTN